MNSLTAPGSCCEAYLLVPQDTGRPTSFQQQILKWTYVGFNLSQLCFTSSSTHPENDRETYPPMSLEVSLLTLVWLQILQWSCNLALAPPSLGQGIIPPIQGPVRRQEHPCLESNVCRHQPWLWTKSSPGTQFLSLSAMVQIQSCPTRDTSSDMSGALTGNCQESHMSVNLVRTRCLRYLKWILVLLNKVLKAVPSA